MPRSSSLNVEEIRTRLANIANAMSPEHRSTAAALGHLLVATFGASGAADTASPPPSASATETSPLGSSTPHTKPSASPDVAAAPAPPLSPRFERILGALHQQLQHAGVTPRARPRADIPIVPIPTWPPEVDDV